MNKLKLAVLAGLTLLSAAPADALPSSVKISQFSELEQQLRAVESEVASRGVGRSEGVTLRLQNYLEDVVVLAGKSAVISPAAIADTIETEFKRGADKRTISSKLVDYYKTNKFRS